MPKMDGKEATGEIRALEAQLGTHVPIVALTAHAMDSDKDGILAAGLDQYLTKPPAQGRDFRGDRRALPQGGAPNCQDDGPTTAVR